MRKQTNINHATKDQDGVFSVDDEPVRTVGILPEEVGAEHFTLFLGHCSIHESVRDYYDDLGKLETLRKDSNRIAKKVFRFSYKPPPIASFVPKLPHAVNKQHVAK